MTYLLSAYVLNNVKKPMSALIEELHDIEFSSARLIDIAWKRAGGKNPHIGLNPMLASALSFLTFGGPRNGASATSRIPRKRSSQKPLPRKRKST